MNRSKFLSLAGLGFVGAIFFPKTGRKNLLSNECNDPITPPVPEGPFYKDEQLNRVDITEHKTGIPITYVFMVEDEDCKPVESAIVDIWQCDADGVYSDYKVEKTLNETWLRGYQKTGADGKCTFRSIFPGWYNGRITHLHGKVHLDGKTLLTTNFFFPKEIENNVYASPLYPKGPNPTPVLEDYELRVDKDTKRHDTLVMDVSKDNNGNLVAFYKVSMA
jgi:protocatechuate 3,4-dioxygenase beta subunit